jgi:hypothetical protein
MGIINPGSTYWNVATGLEKVKVESDTEGLNTAWNVDKNVVNLVKRLKIYFK